MRLTFHIAVIVLICMSSITKAIANDMNSRRESLRQYYAEMSTLHLVAHQTVTLHDKGQQVIKTRYESWFDGGRYRIDVVGEDQLAATLNYNIAYDDDKTQILRNSDGYLTFTQSKKTDFGMLPENPLFAPVMFLHSNQKEISSDVLFLSDVVDANTWKQIVIMDSRESEDGSESVCSIKGGKFYGVPIQYQLHFAPQSSDIPTWLPLRIDRIADGNQLLTSTEIEYSKPEDKPNTWFPAMIKTNGYVDGKLKISSDVTVSYFDPSPEVVHETLFTIDISKARSIYNADTGVFLKQPETPNGLLRDIDTLLKDSSDAANALHVNKKDIDLAPMEVHNPNTYDGGPKAEYLSTKNPVSIKAIIIIGLLSLGILGAIYLIRHRPTK